MQTFYLDPRYFKELAIAYPANPLSWASLMGPVMSSLRGCGKLAFQRVVRLMGSSSGAAHSRFGRHRPLIGMARPLIGMARPLISNTGYLLLFVVSAEAAQHDAIRGER